MSIVITEDHGQVRHVIMNRPEKRNAMSQELLRALAAALRSAAADANVQCVVLRGEGPVFSAGVDLAELASFAARADVLRPFRDVFLECANLCEQMPKPVVCQIQRTCVGGALEVALGCDLRVASSDAQFGLPEVRFGIIPDVGGCTRLPAVVGLGRAKELIMTARLIDALEAERIGLVNRVVPAADLDREAMAFAERLAAGAPLAVRYTKLAVNKLVKEALNVAFDTSTALELVTFQSEDHLEALAALREKRPPAFKGR
jgi:enoyl-CoA hydratase/carnithine racemase